MLIVLSMVVSCSSDKKEESLSSGTSLPIGSSLTIEASADAVVKEDMPGWFSLKDGKIRAQIKKRKFGKATSADALAEAMCKGKEIDVAKGDTPSGHFVSCRGPGSAEVGGKRLETTTVATVVNVADEQWECRFEYDNAARAAEALQLCKSMRPAK